MMPYAIQCLALLALDMVQKILHTRQHFGTLRGLNAGSSVTCCIVVFGFCDDVFLLSFINQLALFGTRSRMQDIFARRGRLIW